MNSILDDFKLAFKTGNVLNQIIIVNVVIFLAFAVINVFFTFAGQGATFDAIGNYLMLPSNLNTLLTQPWTLITYGFFHKGFFHILFNMLYMYWFGRIISEYLGQNKLLGLYVWGVIGGGLLYLLAYNVMPYFENQVMGSYLLGASGGVVAIVVGAATFQPNFAINLIFLGPVKLKYIAAVTVFISFIQSTGSNAGGEIAHLGGALVGYLSIKQLQRGSDWSKPIVSIITWVKSLFKPQPKIKVSYKKAKTTSGRSSSKAKAKAEAKSKSSQDEIDAILDKISEKGYDALSKEEKQKLFNASKD